MASRTRCELSSKHKTQELKQNHHFRSTFKAATSTQISDISTSDLYDLADRTFDQLPYQRV